MDSLNHLDQIKPIIPSRQASMDTQIIQKPLPPPPTPFDRTASEAPVSGAVTGASENVSQTHRPPSSSGSLFQRPRKRVIWRNKACFIALPIDSEFGKKTTRDSYLKPEDVDRRLQEWESKGYKTKGFVLAPLSPGSMPNRSEGQSREVYPDLEDERRERIEHSYRVSIPNRNEWEAYVDRLKEEKLRALGVSFGDDDPPRKSPAPSLMSQQGSSQSSVLLTSPGLAAHSVHAMPFQPGSQTAPTPTPHMGKPSVSHFPHYSMTMSFGEQQPAQFPRLPQSPVYGQLPPMQHLASQSGSRVASPNTDGHIPSSIRTIPSESPPIQKNLGQVASPGAGGLFNQMRQQQAYVHAQQLQQYQQHQHQQFLRSHSQSAADPQSKLERRSLPIASRTHSDIACPVPRGHRPNPSGTLQKDIDEAHIYSEATVKQDENQQSPRSFEKYIPMDEAATPKLSKEEPSLNGKVNGSQGELNPSLSGTPDHLNCRQSLQQRDHASKASTSKLNVNAPEFKYEPRQPKGAEVFAFVGDQEPPTQKPDANFLGNSSDHAKVVENGSSQVTKFNVEAPEFTPGMNVRKPTVPSREFSFSASMPAFRPDAPDFKPSDSEVLSSSDTSNKENSVEAVKKIFGEIKFSEKRSRAIPIIKPDAALTSPDKSSPDSAGQEDESGRITQADGRQKRVKRNLDDGDQVPLFASPNITPLLNLDSDDRAAHFSRTPSPSSEQAEPTTVDAATDLLEEIIDDLSATEASDLMKEDEWISGNGKTFEPHAFHDIDDAVNFNAARPPVSFREQSKRHLDPTPDDVARATINFLGRSPQFKADVDRAHESHFPGSQSTPRDNLLSADGIDRVDHASQAIMDGVRYIEPSYDELDAVLGHRNGDPNNNVERRPSRFRRRGQSISPVRSSAPEHQHTSRSPVRGSAWEIDETSSTPQLLLPANLRSDAPSPSPNRLREPTQCLPQTDSESANTSALETIEKISRDIARNPLDSPSWPAKNPIPIHRLNSPGSTPPSDWNDVVSSLDEDKFHSRTAFFDNHVNNVVGSVIQQRLGPLEQAVTGIQQMLAAMSNRSASRRPRSSGTVEIADSDADDEEDTDMLSQARVISPLKDRKYDQLRASLNDISAAQRNFLPATQLTEVMEAVKDLKSSLSHGPLTQTGIADIRTIIEDAVGKQLRGRSAPVTSSSIAAVAEKSQLHIAGLESMLKIAEDRANDELKARRSTEDAFVDNQRLLRSALQEAAEQRESAEATERTLEQFSEERQEILQRNAVLQRSERDLQKTVSDLSDKTAALEDTLAEYRLSSDQWRNEIDDARHENKDLRRNISSLKAEIDENNEHRQALRIKFDGLQEEMSRVSNATLTDQLRRQGKEQEHTARLEMLGARLEVEARTRERLELEIERFEAQEKEAMGARLVVEQTQKANSQLQDMVAELRSESHKHQNSAAHFEREYHNAKESSAKEVARVRMIMEVDIQAANKHVNITRADLEAVIGKLHGQIEDAKVDAESVRTRHEIVLSEAMESQRSAVQEAAETQKTALKEQQRSHEKTLEEMREQHEHLLNNALEDRERSETYLGNRLNLANEKVVHYQDRITHLEEKLEIAKSAAHAAVQAAQNKKIATSPNASHTTHRVTKASDIPEKISPQALRESILVLQEQLQERESRIEQFESEMSAIDTTAPAKLRDAEVEITWLRELLGVRIDDLKDIIATLSQSSYDREAVKDAAIRLKANLQMEQQEKERAMAGGQSCPSLTSISNLAASPKALPLAAAAAWGNWRKGRENFSNLGALVANGSVQQTPSKSSPQSFFAGLMTPPNTNMRTTPPLASNPRPLCSSTHRAVNAPTTPRQNANGRVDRRQQQEPVTPPLNLMRKTSYDLDASESVEGFGDEGVEGNWMAGEDEEPFGPR